MSRILIVDDDPITRLLLSDMLTRAGYETTLANDGTQALKMLADKPRFDVVLSDIRMPRMDGFQLFNALIADYPYLPVILSSVHTDADRVREVLKKGAAFLPRPFTREQVSQAVHAAAHRPTRMGT